MAYQLPEINERIRSDVAGFLEECDQNYRQRIALAADRIIANMEKSPLVLLSGLVWLSGCKPKIPEPVEEVTMKADLPEELRTVTIGGETWRVQDTILEVGERNTDLDHQTDDISCRVTLTGEGFSVSYPCDLHYAYVRSSGWGLFWM